MQNFILLILELITLSSEAIYTSFRIIYIQDGVQDGTRQVLQSCVSSVLPEGMSDGFVTDLTHCLIEQHFTTCVDEFMNPACMSGVVAMYKQAYLALGHQTCLM